jgi:hypothetical protein
VTGRWDSPGRLVSWRRRLTPATQWAPATHTWRGPHSFSWWLLFLVAARASRALSRLRCPRSPRKERLGSLLLRTAARAIADARSQVTGSFVLSGSSRIARFADARSHVAALGPLRLLKPGLTQLSGGLHMLQPVQTAKNLCIHRFLTSDEGCATTPCGRQRAAMDSKRVCALARWDCPPLLRSIRLADTALDVPGHQVGDSRLVGGRPPSATRVARVGVFDGEDAWESARCLSPTGAKSPSA